MNRLLQEAHRPHTSIRGEEHTAHCTRQPPPIRAAAPCIPFPPRTCRMHQFQRPLQRPLLHKLRVKKAEQLGGLRGAAGQRKDGGRCEVAAGQILALQGRMRGGGAVAVRLLLARSWLCRDGWGGGGYVLPADGAIKRFATEGQA